MTLPNQSRHAVRRSALCMLSTLAVVATALFAPAYSRADGLSSSLFPNWSPGVQTADVSYTASTDAHEGNYALEIDNRTTRPGGRYGTFEQTIPVKANTRYDFTSWVKADGVTDQGLQVVMSPNEDDWKIRANFPAGTYDWRKYDWSYTTTATQTSFVYRILTQDRETAWLDSLSMVEHGTTTNLLTNAGFEQNSVAATKLVISSPQLLFTKGDTHITLKSSATTVSPAQWTVSNLADVQVRNGKTSFVDGSASIDLRRLGPGYYRLSVTATADGTRLARTTDFAVLGPKSAVVGGKDSPFGASTHFGQSWNPDLMSVMHLVGYGQFRDEIDWAGVEKFPGQYKMPAKADTYMTRAAQEGLNPLFIADYRNPLYDNGKTPSTREGFAAFAKYASAVADAYPNLTDVEVYNEFNAGFNDGACGRTPQCYLPMLRATYEQVKKDNPDATIAGPATAGMSTSWIEQLIDLGGLKYLDAVTTHPYRYPGPPESLAADLNDLRSYIRDHNDGKDKPIWLTELGWPTHTGASGVTESAQADYLIRAEVLSLANGVNRFYWYDLLNDGTDPTYNENNFGLLRQPSLGVVGNAPKPGIVSQAVLIRALAGLKYSGKDDLGDGIWSYRFGKSHPTRVIWATTPTTVALSTRKSVTVTDRFGVKSTLRPTAGTVQLGLDGHPIVVTGDVSSVHQLTHPTFGIKVEDPTAVGDPVSVTLRVDRTGTKPQPVPRTVVFTIDDTEYRVPTRPHQVSTHTVDLPAASAPGPRVVTGTVRSTRNTARVTATATISPSTTVQVVPEVTSTSPVSGNALVQVTNNRRSAADFDALDWTIGGISGHAELGAIDGRDTHTTTIPLPSVKAWDPIPFTVTVTPTDTAGVTASGTTGLDPVEPDGSDQVPPIDLASQGKPTFTGHPYGGAADLSGTVKLGYTEQALTVHAAITDNSFSQGNAADQMWAGDSIQLSISDGVPGAVANATELGFAKLTDGTGFYSWSNADGSPAGPTSGATGNITRDGDVTAYDVSIPWTSIGFDKRPAGPVALSLVVNDSDTGNRDGWMEWGGGIATNKSTSLFRPLVFLN